jgi:hypothetical protein
MYIHVCVCVCVCVCACVCVCVCVGGRRPGVHTMSMLVTTSIFRNNMAQAHAVYASILGHRPHAVDGSSLLVYQAFSY